MCINFHLFHHIYKIQIAGKINKVIRELGLRDVGQLEQDLVFGDAGTKELIEFLRKNQVQEDSFSARKNLFFWR